MYALRYVLGVFALLALGLIGQHLRLGASGPPQPRDNTLLRLASVNVHYIVLGQTSGRWSETGWQNRRGAVDASFKALDADIVAFQEMESFQRGSDGSVNLARDWLLAKNPDYAVTASGDWREFPVTQPIFYRKDRLTPRDQGWFFFSDTPDVLYSRTFNGSWPAFCSWAEFEDQQGRRFRVYNLHFEYRSRSNRRLSAALVRDRIAAVIASGLPVIVLGDLNALHGSATMQLLEQADVEFARVNGATYHLDRGLHLFGAIDHVGLSPNVQLSRGPWVDRRRFDGVRPSDHYPVVADVTLK